MLKIYSAMDELAIDWHAQLFQQDNFVIHLADCQQITFIETPKIPLSSAYQKAVNQHWDVLLSQHSGKLWNNRVLSIYKITQYNQKLTLYYSYTEYKYIMYKKHKGLSYLQTYYPENIENHSFTAILPQLENQYLWGIVGSGTIQSEGLLDMIGGTIEYEPDFSWQKLQRKTCEELAEETSLMLPPKALQNFTLNYHAGCVFFLFKSVLSTQQLQAQKVDKVELKQTVLLTINDITKRDLKERDFVPSEDSKFVLHYLR